MFSRVYGPITLILIPLIWLGVFQSIEQEEKLLLTILIWGGLAPIMWVDTILVCGVQCLRSVPIIGGLFLRTRKSAVVAALLFVNYFFWFPPFGRNTSPYGVYVVVTLGMVALLLWLQPPYAFVLGESVPHTGRVLSSLSLGVSPLRVVAMLDHRHAGRFLGAFSILTDDLRADSDNDWRDIVDNLIDCVPLIVIDTRTNSKSVINEVGEILSKPDQLQRTVFVIGQDGEASVLSAHAVAINAPGVFVISEDEISKITVMGLLRPRV